DLWVMRLRPESPLTFKPGQYLTLGLMSPTEGKMIERPYSVVSSPAEPEIEFFIELVHDGKLTPLLHKLTVGDPVSVRPSAKGRFTLDRESGNRHHLMVGSVTGVVPYISMTRHLANHEHDASHNVLVLHSASLNTEFAYEQEMTERARSNSWMT